MHALLLWLYPQPMGSDTVTWAEVWQAGGFAMVPIVLLGFMGAMVAAALIPFTLLKRASPPTALPAGAVLAAGLLVIAFGVVGQQTGLGSMEEALANVNPADIEAIRIQGSAEAAVPFRFGLLLGVPLVLAGALLLSLGRRNGAVSGATPASAGDPG